LLPDRTDQLLGPLERQSVITGAEAPAGSFAPVLETDAPVGAFEAAAIGFDADRPKQIELPFPAGWFAISYAIIGVHTVPSYASL
jgi:hypothetical protein